MPDPSSAFIPGRTPFSWLLVAPMVLLGCTADDPESGGGDTTPGEAGTSLQDETLQDGRSGQDTFTIAGTGDILIHDNLIDEAAALAEDADYTFGPLLEGTADLIGGADLALCGLEAPLAPEGTEPEGYPVFAAPPELADDLAQAGFHGCSTANNHSFDQGAAGLDRTLNIFDEAGLGHAGTARTEAEAARPQLYTLQRGGGEVTVAHIATTMIHNQAHPPPEDQAWRVTDVTAAELTDQAAAAREAGADVVVASVHWGEEYDHEPTEKQRDYGEQLAAGEQIDVVLGSHSHTPQPVEKLDGGPAGQGMWVVWSMGNFLSNQDEACCVPETASGTVVYATVQLSDDVARVSAMDWLPVTVDRGPTDDQPHRGVWPLRDLLEGDTPSEVRLSTDTLEARWSRMREVMTEQNLREDPPTPTGEGPVVLPRGG